jgi:hypothetical protein
MSAHAARQGGDDALLPPRPFEAVWPQLMALLVSQGKSDEAWNLELRREERIAWEIEQTAGPSAGSKP